MRFWNPLNLYQDYYEETEYLPDDSSLWIRAYIVIKIISMHLLFGCVLTIVFFKLRRFVGTFMSFVCCGECDCDNDGSGRLKPDRKRGRSRSKGRTRSCCHKSKSRARDENRWIGGCSSVWDLMNALYMDYTIRRQVRMVIVLVIGLITGYLVASAYYLESEEPPTMVYSFSDSEVLNEDVPNSRRVFFMTPTAKSGIQIPRLTRLAQALYRNRDFVTWVVISVDPVKIEPWSNRQWEHWNELQMYNWKNSQTNVINHLQNLEETLNRFGINYVLLSAHDVHSGFTEAQVLSQTTAFTKGAQVGFSWVLKTFTEGVVLIGLEDAVYNFNLFREVRETKKMSSWPTAFDSRYVIRLTTPILFKQGNAVKGYFGGAKTIVGELPLEYGTYALNIKTARRFQQTNALWKLTVDKVFSTKDLNLTTTDVQHMGHNCTEIYVWKLSTIFSFSSRLNKQRLPLKFKWAKTNIPRILMKIKNWFALNLGSQSQTRETRN